MSVHTTKSSRFKYFNFFFACREGKESLSDIELMEQYHKDVADLKKRYNIIILLLLLSLNKYASCT